MLMQFDPFREFDRLAGQLAGGARPPRPFPMDAYRRGDETVVSFHLPGMASGAIDLTVEQNVLTIKAQRLLSATRATRSSPPSAHKARSPASCSSATRSTPSASRPAVKTGG